MSTTISVTADAVWSDPAIEGLEVFDAEWRLNVDRYLNFIETATGISPNGEISASDCYRIGNRLYALVEERKRHEEWDSSLVEEYPDIKSLKEFLWVARFFLICHECSNARGICYSPRKPDDACISAQ
ncbi:hypothetical protein [Natrinema soli]|uniref:Uncharacterized protein n=1 Tax=Natrinema soli TaxID=1930624 RepID=A0ABD5SHC4_9EURY|nr:hypothetical protein [Natrinema soli]